MYYFTCAFIQNVNALLFILMMIPSHISKLNLVLINFFLFLINWEYLISLQIHIAHPSCILRILEIPTGALVTQFIIVADTLHFKTQAFLLIGAPRVLPNLLIHPSLDLKAGLLGPFFLIIAIDTSSFSLLFDFKSKLRYSSFIEHSVFIIRGRLLSLRNYLLALGVNSFFN